MMAQTAIAPANLRPLAPAPSTSQQKPSSPSISTSASASTHSSTRFRGNSRSQQQQQQQQSISIRPLKPLAVAAGAAPSTSTNTSSTAQPRRTIAIAPTSGSSSGAKAVAASSSASALRSSPINIRSSPSRNATLNTAHSAASSAEGSSSNNTAASHNQREDSVGSSTSTSNSTTSREVSEMPGVDATNTALTTLMKAENGGGTVQPSKEWVLPARAKPGRKPSEVEPPTKRKAQNRASQRAFRERKQSYVASLEQKIEEYEKRGAELSSELQKVARRLKEENDQLVKENAQLKDRIHLLEQEREQEQAQTPGGEQKGRYKMLVSPPAKRTAGVRNHLQSKHAMSSAEALISNKPSVVGGGGKNLWPWGGDDKGNSGGDDMGSTKGLEMDRDCGFCTEDSLCVCRGEAVLDLTEGNDDEEEDEDEEEDDDDEDEAAVKHAHSPVRVKQEDPNGARDREYRNRYGSLHPSLPSPSQTAPLDLPLNKTTKKLWYTVPGPIPTTTSSSSSSMMMNAGHPRQVQVCPTESRYRLPFRLGSNSNVLPPLQITAQGKPKLWPVYSSVPQSPRLSRSGNESSADASSAAAQNQVNTVPIYRLRKPVALAPGESAPACSGDPAHCGACSTDPALAAFCRAVASHLDTASSSSASSPTASASTSTNATVTPAILDAGNALPLRNLRKRSHSTTVGGSSMSNTYTNPAYQAATATSRKPMLRHSLTSGYPRYPLTASVNSSSSSSSSSMAHFTDRRLQSIPEAWRMIKRHPQFSSWKGGLDMLADVVSKKAHSEDASSSLTTAGATPSDGQHQQTEEGKEDEQRKERENARVEIPRRPSISMKFHKKSSDRLSRETLPTSEQIAQIDDTAQTAAKRRRLYVEREGVEDALALLDRNGKGTTSTEGGSNTARKEAPSSSSSPHCEENSESKEACVCPLNRLM